MSTPLLQKVVQFEDYDTMVEFVTWMNINWGYAPVASNHLTVNYAVKDQKDLMDLIGALRAACNYYQLTLEF